MYQHLTKLLLAGAVAVALLALGSTLLNPFIGQALAQVTECPEGMTEIILVLPNGTEKLICVPDSAVEVIEDADDNAPIEFITEKTVFVTSLTFTGDLRTAAFDLTGTAAASGLEAGDLICQKLARDAGIGGTFLAWLAEGVAGLNSPVLRFVQSDVPYRLLDGTKIADSWADLTEGPVTLDNPISLTETLMSVGNDFVWTGADDIGSTFPGQNVEVNCSGWRGFNSGLVGFAGATDFRWTEDSLVACFNPDQHLYCFEQ